jgi:hypothetical protein
MRHLSCHANAFTQCRVRVNRLADVDRVSAHFDGQCNLANHVARMGADHAAAEDFAVTVSFWTVVKQQLGDTFVAVDFSSPMATD